MPAWAIKPLLYLAGLAAIVWALHAGYSSIYQRGYDAKTLEVNMQRMADERTQAIAALAREAEVRAIEVANDAKMDAVATNLETGKVNVESTESATADGLRDGSVRVQRRLQCPPAVARAEVPRATQSGRGDHATGEGGLTPEIATLALGIAADGDRAIVQLAACQAAIRVMQATQ